MANDRSYKGTRIATPEEAASNLNETELFGKENWASNYRFGLAQSFISKKSPTRNQKLLDFGCGNGLFLNFLERNCPHLSSFGYDPYAHIETNLVGSRTKIFTESKHIPANQFDFVTALDVIEHIEEHECSLKLIHKIIKNDGDLLIIVPAHQWLYSPFDAAVGHYRRYSKQSLLSLLDTSGFFVSHFTYIFSFLVIPGIARKYFLLALERAGFNSKNIAISKNSIGIFSVLSRYEFALINKLDFRLPFGYSIFVVANKKNSECVF